MRAETTLKLEFSDKAELDRFSKMLAYWAVCADFEQPNLARKNTLGLMLAMERELPEWVDDMEPPDVQP